MITTRASNKNALGDVYVKFFRWAVDRLQGRDGVVCFVSNNGNIRINPKLSGTTHNVFGIQLGVGITIAIRSSQHQARQVFYYRVPEFWRKGEKLALKDAKKERVTAQPTIFKAYSPGAQTNRDNWMYDFDPLKRVLCEKVDRGIQGLCNTSLSL